MLWLCLRFPLLPLEALLQDEYHHPAAVMERHSVLICNSAAVAAGIKPGVSLATAQALSSVARIFDRDTQRESHALQTLAYACYRFTPAVTIQPPDCLLLEIGGCLKLFKGLQRLLTLLNNTLIDLGHDHTAGLAVTPKAAVLLSRAGMDITGLVDPAAVNPNAVDPNAVNPSVNDPAANDAARDLEQSPAPDQQHYFDNLSGALIDPDEFNRHLHAQPLAMLDCSPKLKDKFLATGFYCLGDLLRLPGAAVGKRYGKGFLIYLKHLSGELPDPQRTLQLPPQFASKLHFNDGITSSQMLIFPMKRLLLALCGYLHGRQLHCSSILWRLHLAGGKTDDLTLHFTQPHHQLEHFLALSRLQLENRAMAAPIESLTLRAIDLHPAEQKNTDLFGQLAGNGQDSDHNLAVVLDKLRTRLGSQAVCGLSLADSHIPEQAWQSTDLTTTVVSASGVPRTAGTAGKSQPGDKPGDKPGKLTDPACLTYPKSHTPMHRPLWLLETPVPVQVNGQRLYWRGELELLQGPERITGDWWRQSICRDYFVARHHNGALYWIYRDHLAAQWFVHGAFA